MRNNALIEEMVTYYSGDPKRIQHFLKVYEFAKIIGQEEGLDEATQHILETAAIVHDIGIKVAEEKYGNCSGPLQEKEGPVVARPMLESLGYDADVIDRVCYLVGHHHTYTDIDGLDYQILVEADFLVNLYEDQASEQAIQNSHDRIFKTKTGSKLCETMFGMNIL